MIICADDFGSTVGVNAAVGELHQISIVTHAALMADGPEFNHAIRVAKSNPDLKIGLHLVLTDENCDSKIPFLTLNGRFQSRSILLQNILLNRISSESIHNEISRQFNKIQSTGIDVSFINGHQHVHILPQISDVVCNFAKDKGLYVRCTNEKFVLAKSLEQNLKKIFLLYLSNKLRHKINKLNLKTNSYLASNFSGDIRDFSAMGFINVLEKYVENNKLISNLELMVHPASNTGDLHHFWYKNLCHADERVLEYESLKSKEFIKFLRSVL